MNKNNHNMNDKDNHNFNSQTDDAEIMDNVPEASEENESAEDIENDEM